MKMTGHARRVRGHVFRTWRMRAGMPGLGRLFQRLGNGHGESRAHSLTAAGQGEPTRGANAKEITKELHGPISSKTVLTAPLGAGRTSLVEESAGQPLAVAANDQLVMQCRHPMLADVDVATRVNVHMPWLVRTEARSAVTAPAGAGIVVLRCGSVKPWMPASRPECWGLHPNLCDALHPLDQPVVGQQEGEQRHQVDHRIFEYPHREIFIGRAHQAEGVIEKANAQHGRTAEVD